MTAAARRNQEQERTVNKGRKKHSKHQEGYSSAMAFSNCRCSVPLESLLPT